MTRSATLILLSGVYPTKAFPLLNPNLGPKKHQNRHVPRQLACFNPATKIVSIAVSPLIAANEL